MSFNNVSSYQDIGEDPMEQLVWQSMDVVGGEASKEQILRIVSITTEKRVLKLVNNVDEAMDNLIEKGLVSKQQGLYQIVNHNE
ncbi:uncharacterized protein [Drosophila takahashii]|uniref:uncharacterized protein n=1 Tax=Drosophila takahashii TaxID=29030 RepID=UPI001CF90533|nr:uncharacterized protein LOC108055134 [Drosophila takahashii]